MVLQRGGRRWFVAVVLVAVLGISVVPVSGALPDAGAATGAWGAWSQLVDWISRVFAGDETGGETGPGWDPNGPQSFPELDPDAAEDFPERDPNGAEAFPTNDPEG